MSSPSPHRCECGLDENNCSCTLHVPHIEIMQANKLWKEERPFFGCSMEQLRKLIRGDNIQDKLGAFVEWLNRYGHAFPRYSNKSKLEE